ncbi:retinoblastoma family protein-like [Condylostylus longicornis]|uniref:retinoblastoma family protein-like n=1 Tax=Condylostylus longicornis TaxID=2530218 RepID=UPI00244DDE58|nr:retinoblastoma family protein-like [Condylostylus longicornis]
MTTDKKDIEKISQKYVNICRELNMDKETEQKSWRTFQEVIKTNNLEGESSHWLCCALYAACRDSFTPTVGSAGSVIKGNCVSLTKLLRSCQISISEFLTKIRKWIEFTKLSQSFINQIERLERSFGISCVLYHKYNETFQKMFILPENDKKTKKSKPGTISSSMLYEFCWCLFLSAKSEDPNHTLDIVTSFHLLLCGMDLIYLCILREKRTELINGNFAETIKSKFADVEKEFRVLHELCQMHDAQYIEAKDIKMYSFKTIIEKFLKNKILQGTDKNFLDILTMQNFEYNYKSINNSYEQYVLSIGEIDERILLNNINVKQSNTDIDFEKSIKSLIPCTPLTRRHHLPNKETSEPIFNATQNVKKLKALGDRHFSIEFLKYLNQAGICTTKIEERISVMCNTFCEKYPSKYEDLNKFNLAKNIYYNLLEKITRAELRNKPTLKLQILLDNEILHTTLIACCVEIVIAAYNSDVKFPWILKCFDIQAFNFYKIIEIVVTRHEDILTRSLIIHLNTIEEKCLDYLSWKGVSPLWVHIKQLNGSIPPWSNVDNRINVHSVNLENVNNRQVILSPINSAYECFNQVATGSDCARRDLFNVGKAAAAEVTKTNEKIQHNTQNKLQQQEDTPKKGINSVKLFLRKFYKLAYMRIHELCKELDLQDDIILNQIWTIFEYSIVNKTELMRDRHLDQLIMCAIYVFIKVKEVSGKTFTDIMKYYRNQPQAASNIYREVLIKPAIEKPNGEKEPAFYNDIISFYNAVYVPMMQSYVLGFGENTQRGVNLLLSPHPPEKMMSPRKLTANHHLYIKTLEKANISQSPVKYTFNIYKSPAKELEKINQHIKAGRRNLPFDNDEVLIKKRRNENTYVTKKIQDFIKERQADDKN